MGEGLYKKCNDFLTATEKMWILTKHSALFRGCNTPIRFEIYK